MSRLLCLGLNHTTAPLEIRERLSLAPSALQAALARFGPMHCNERPEGISEATILSTCNRLEVYAFVKDLDEGAASLTRLLSEANDVPEDDFRDHLYTYSDEEAVRHWMRVAAGLDSLVVGEPQILGQVTDAYKAAMAHGAAGTVLAALFRAASTRASGRAPRRPSALTPPQSVRWPCSLPRMCSANWPSARCW